METMDEKIAKTLIFKRFRGVDKVIFGCYNEATPREIGAYNWIKKGCRVQSRRDLYRKAKMDSAAKTSHIWASDKAYVPNRNNNVFRFAMTHDWYDDTSALQLIGIWDVNGQLERILFVTYDSRSQGINLSREIDVTRSSASFV